MEDRKIGFTDWIHIRKWHYYLSSFMFGMFGVTVKSFLVQDWQATFTAGITFAMCCIFYIVRMAQDKELNEKNGIKRFWLNF